MTASTRRSAGPVPQRTDEDWTDEDRAAAAYGDGHGVSKTATTRDGRQWELRGDHDITETVGDLAIANPITGDVEELEPVESSLSRWKRNPKHSLFLTESGHLAVLSRWTQGAGTRGYGIEYAGPYLAFESGEHPVLDDRPLEDAWGGSEPADDADADGGDD